ncbi:hypothetical protein V1511DRAFT_510825 [Dipodascopsis uninucleata]
MEQSWPIIAGIAIARVGLTFLGQLPVSLGQGPMEHNLGRITEDAYALCSQAWIHLSEIKWKVTGGNYKEVIWQSGAISRFFLAAVELLMMMYLMDSFNFLI